LSFLAKAFAETVTTMKVSHTFAKDAGLQLFYRGNLYRQRILNVK